MPTAVLPETKIQIPKGGATGTGTSRGQKTAELCAHDQFTIYQQCFIPYPWRVRSPNSRPTTTLFQQLAENNCQPVGATGSLGLQARNDINPKLTAPSKIPGYQEQSLTRWRNTEVNRQGGSDKGPPLSTSVRKSDLPGS